MCCDVEVLNDEEEDDAEYDDMETSGVGSGAGWAGGGVLDALSGPSRGTNWLPQVK